MASDRIFGLIALFVALAYIASATQIQTSFLSDPLGPKAFPILTGAVAALCALVIAFKPDGDPVWPGFTTFAKIGIAIVVLSAYAYALRPVGFIIPTAIAATIISYLIEPRRVQAAIAGVALSVGLFLIFKYALGLGLFAFPRSWFA